MEASGKWGSEYSSFKRNENTKERDVKRMSGIKDSHKGIVRHSLHMYNTNVISGLPAEPAVGGPARTTGTNVVVFLLLLLDFFDDRRRGDLDNLLVDPLDTGRARNRRSRSLFEDFGCRRSYDTSVGRSWDGNGFCGKSLGMMLSECDCLSFDCNFNCGFGVDKRRRKSFKVRSILGIVRIMQENECRRRCPPSSQSSGRY